MRELPGYRPWLQIGPNRSKGQDFRLMPCHEHPGAIQLSPTFRPFAWCRGSWCSPFGSSFSAALKELAGDDVSRTLQHFFWKIIFFIFFHFFFQVLCLLLRRSFQCLCEFQHLVPAAEAPLSSGVTLGQVLRFTQAVPCNWSFNLWPTKTGISLTKTRYATVIEQHTVGYINRNNENLGTSPEFHPQDIHHLLFHSCTMLHHCLGTYINL